MLDDNGWKTVGPISNWAYVTVSFDGNNYSIYYNGNPVGVYPFISSASSPTLIRISGWSNGMLGKFNGKIDEVRLSNASHSADWIATEYNNQSNPSSFYFLGDEEAIPSASFISP